MERFPKTFLWGAATSSYQVEGDNRNSDWWHWEKKNKKSCSGEASNFWHDYPEYIFWLKQAKLNSFRLSIEWARVNPKENQWDEGALYRYQEIILALKKNNIEPILTLWHFTLPKWIADKGGWENPETLIHFKNYIRKIKALLDKEIRYWLILNEPSVYIFKAYLEGDWPPQKKMNIFSALKVRENLIKAHQEGSRLLKNRQNLISSAFNLSFGDPVPNWNPINILIAKILFFLSDWGFMLQTKNDLDYTAVNYYFHDLIRFPWQIAGGDKKSEKLSDLKWEIYPRGIFEVCKKAYQITKKPVMITENGLADKKDLKRESFLKEHIFWLNYAFKTGTPIIGYQHWSLVDNFEWSMGKTPRFGLIEMDYKNLEMKPRNSLWFYKKLIEAYSEKV